MKGTNGHAPDVFPCPVTSCTHNLHGECRGFRGPWICQRLEADEYDYLFPMCGKYQKERVRQYKEEIRKSEVEE